nr:hypothetical protein L204_02245 [Cryptococcus depauperatus CBS 7855]
MGILPDWAKVAPVSTVPGLEKHNTEPNSKQRAVEATLLESRLGYWHEYVERSVTTQSFSPEKEAKDKQRTSASLRLHLSPLQPTAERLFELNYPDTLSAYQDLTTPDCF